MKKGFALSINFLVAMILAIAVFGFGIYFSNMLFSKAGDVQENIDAQTKSQIVELLNSGEKVVIPQQRIKLRPSSNGVFGIGISNVDDSLNDRFSIGFKRTLFKADGTSGNPINLVLKHRFVENTEFALEPGKDEVYSVSIDVPSSAAKGDTFVIDVKVCHDNDGDVGTGNVVDCPTNPGYELYDETIHKVYIEIY